jgi:hypothetical protein
MDATEAALREEYFEGHLSDSMTLDQFFLEKGFPQYAGKGDPSSAFALGRKKGGTVKSSSKKSKSNKGSKLRGTGIAKKGFRKAKIR